MNKKKTYQDAMEQGKTPEIEMPPLPEEQIEDEATDTGAADTVIHEEQAVPQEPEEVQQKQSNQENIRILREKAKSADKFQQERDALLQRMQEMELRQKKEAVPEVDDNDDLAIQPDDLVEGKHLAKIAKKYKKLEDQLKNYQRQSQESNIETRLKTEYPDFDKVVSKDNIEELKSLYPELAATLHSSPDLYNKGASAYTLIKRLGINREDTYSGDRDRAIKNAAKPRPLTSVSPQQGDSPLSHANAFANGLTDELKKQLLQEMSDARKKR